jgi:hypothetical protein
MKAFKLVSITAAACLAVTAAANGGFALAYFLLELPEDSRTTLAGVWIGVGSAVAAICFCFFCGNLYDAINNPQNYR